MLVGNHVVLGGGVVTNGYEFVVRVFASGMLATGIVQKIAGYADHPRNLGSFGHIVKSSPGNDQHLFYEVVNIGITERIGPSSEKAGHGGRREARQVPQSILS